MFWKSILRGHIDKNDQKLKISILKIFFKYIQGDFSYEFKRGIQVRFVGRLAYSGSDRYIIIQFKYFNCLITDLYVVTGDGFNFSYVPMDDVRKMDGVLEGFQLCSCKSSNYFKLFRIRASYMFEQVLEKCIFLRFEKVSFSNENKYKFLKIRKSKLHHDFVCKNF